MSEVHDRNHVKDAEAERPTRVIAVLGTSFSGSTLLNLMLGAHRRIYAGGEMIGLILHRDQYGSGTCTSCGFECRIWTGDARMRVSKDNLYRVAEAVARRHVIVDTSKSLEWFSEVLGGAENRGVQPYYVLVVKHPIRYLSSCLVNIEDAAPRGRLARLVSKLGDTHRRKALLDEWADDLASYYDGVFRHYGRNVGGASFHAIRYEDLVRDRRATLKPILSSVGLDYDDLIDDFYSADFHQIGGNNGAIFQINQSWHGADNQVSQERKKFYESAKAVRMDDKYKKVFSASELVYLKSHPSVRRVCEQFDYAQSGDLILGG